MTRVGDAAPIPREVAQNRYDLPDAGRNDPSEIEAGREEGGCACFLPPFFLLLLSALILATASACAA